jgi:hypothetical protein
LTRSDSRDRITRSHHPTGEGGDLVLHVRKTDKKLAPMLSFVKAN